MCKAPGTCLALSKCSVNVSDHNPDGLHLLSICCLCVSTCLIAVNCTESRC